MGMNYETNSLSSPPHSQRRRARLGPRCILLGGHLPVRTLVGLAEFTDGRKHGLVQLWSDGRCPNHTAAHTQTEADEQAGTGQRRGDCVEHFSRCRLLGVRGRADAEHSWKCVSF